MFGYNTTDYELKTDLAPCCNGIGTVYMARHKPSNEIITLKKFKMDKADKENSLIRVSKPTYTAHTHTILSRPYNSLLPPG